MTLSTANQAYIFLATVYAGLLLGLIYDVYRAFRMITKPGKVLLAVFDLFFWIQAALFSFYMFFKVNDGEIRLYAYLGLALGWGLYILTVGSLVVKFLVKAYRIVSNIFLWPIRMTVKGVKWIGGKIPVRKDIEDEEGNTLKQ